MLHVSSTTPDSIAAAHSELRTSTAIAPAVIAFVLLFLSGPAAPSEHARDVTLPDPQITLSPARQVLDACHNKSQVGCTVFAPVEFRCACSFEGDQWHIAAGVSAIARVYVSRPAYIPHELQHISDFRSRLQAYVVRVSARRYATDSECDRGAEEAKNSFTAAVADVVRITVEKRDSNPLPPPVLLSRKR